MSFTWPAALRDMEFCCSGVTSLSRDSAGGLLVEVLASNQSVDFPTVTDICELAFGNPAQTLELVEILAAALRKGNDLTLQLKATTIAHELLYDGCARKAMFEAPGLLQALECLRFRRASGPSKDGPVLEILRLLSSEVMRQLVKEFCFEL
mmetsp:Transcript_63949/g.169260  ORF Transcript_63949/g.169260 Transcript_63949/m.169260 type:complete len:151 (-) Transcript_63949:308-760(-)